MSLSNLVLSTSRRSWNMAWTKYLTTIVFALVCVVTNAQVNRYMVFFKDKSGSSFSVSSPLAFLSPKAVERRVKQGIDVNEQDIPVKDDYVAGVRSTGAQVFFKSKWYNGVLVQCDQSLINTIQLLPFVDHVEFVAPLDKLQPTSGRKFNILRKKQSEEETANQLNMLGINEMHSAGYKGEAMTIAVLDAGFPGVNTAPAFQKLISEQRIDLEVSHDFVRNSNNVFQYDDHGTQVLSVITAEVPDVFTGGAPEASFQLYVTEDANDEHRIEEYNWTFAAERADSAGADIIQSSLGYYDFDISSMNYTKDQLDGNTTVVTKAAQWAADRGMVVVVSAGNEGNIAWQIVSAPADARDVLAVGSVDANRVRSNSSSKGPTADGRIKPDVAAKGVAVKTITPSGALGSASGTSLACPLITSLVAGVWQRYPELTNLQIMDIIRKSASQAANPDNLLGYGIPNFRAIVNFQESIEQETDFAVYPNPVGDTIKLTPKDPSQQTSCSVALITGLGQVLMNDTAEFSWLDRDYEIDSTSLAKGMYYLQVNAGKKRYVFKVVKE